MLLAALVWLAMTGFAPYNGKEDMRRVPVLMYHSVCKTHVGEFVISPDTLRADFAYLHKNGYETVFVRDVVEYCAGRIDLPDKPIVLTFDDGFYNNAFYAQKIAAEYNIKFTVGIVGAYVAKEEKEKTRSPVYSYLNSRELCAMHRSGNVEFVNHTFDMHKLSPRKGVRKKRGESTTDYEAALIADSEKCRKLVQEACGCRMNVFAYPFGCYSAETYEILARLGYKAVLTCKGGINTFYKGKSDGLNAIMRYNRPGNRNTESFFRSIGV